MSPTSSPSPTTADNITDALIALGKGDGTHSESRKARVLLDTLPEATLAETLPQLWQKDEMRRRKRKPWVNLSVVLCFILGVVYFSLNLLGRGEMLSQHGYRYWASNFQWSLYALSLVVWVADSYYCNFSPLQRGILRLCHARPAWQFVPLMIEMLPFIRYVAPHIEERAAYVSEYRAHLAQVLPLWCQSDSADLMPVQRRILLQQLKTVAFQDIGLNRSIGSSSKLSEADADFCAAVLEALRRPVTSAGSPLDTKTNTTLRRIAATSSHDDSNREYVQEVVLAILNQSQ